jgi:hypothetical protein
MSKSFTRKGVIVAISLIGSFLIGRLRLSLLFEAVLFAGFLVVFMVGLTLWDRHHPR